MQVYKKAYSQRGFVYRYHFQYVQSLKTQKVQGGLKNLSSKKSTSLASTVSESSTFRTSQKTILKQKKTLVVYLLNKRKIPQSKKIKKIQLKKDC